MPRDATPSRCHQHAWADQVYILSESASGARRPYEAPASAMTSIATYHVRIVNGRAAASGEKKFDLSEGIARFGDILKQGGGARRCRAVASGEGSAHDLTPLGWRTAGEQWQVNLEEVACGGQWHENSGQWSVASCQ